VITSEPRRHFWALPTDPRRVHPRPRWPARERRLPRPGPRHRIQRPKASAPSWSP